LQQCASPTAQPASQMNCTVGQFPSERSPLLCEGHCAHSPPLRRLQKRQLQQATAAVMDVQVSMAMTGWHASVSCLPP
jgi:hypothetical protein